jgi:hypothetical protein
MRTALSVNPYKSDCFGLFSADSPLVRCELAWPQQRFAHVKDTRESAPENQGPTRSYAWENKPNYVVDTTSHLL